jgi:hypothetical protein
MIFKSLYFLTYPRINIYTHINSLVTREISEIGFVDSTSCLKDLSFMGFVFDLGRDFKITGLGHLIPFPLDYAYSSTKHHS